MLLWCFVVFYGLFSTLLCTFCGVLWTFLAKIKENIHLCFIYGFIYVFSMLM